jgi:hypothetical protein
LGHYKEVNFQDTLDGVLFVELPRLRFEADAVTMHIESAATLAGPLNDEVLLNNLHKP